MKILAIDPGEKRIGVAISDPTCTLARPLCVIKHQSRESSAEKIAAIAMEEGVVMIVVGQALNANGEIGPQARKSQRLADCLRTKTDSEIVMWDESGTTQAARQSRIDLGVSRKKRRGHLDDLAASILLQDYLIANEVNIKGLQVDDEQS
ncbi:MAG TPA: Holliday junction resolvase RuvX [Brevefilum sp.]|nr:Holliday junction resolvase RuvX [Brevefilum sp.]HOR18892.1 Holliday junction resolvase RuvX [Brevefilum sp.]HPL70027.1 Holliday junction resolvase RuvX [Brevefilum sp.]